MEIVININKSEYPALFKIKNKKLNSIILSVFNTGYNILFPQPDNFNNSNYEYHQIINKIDSLKNNNNEELNEKIKIL